MKYDPELFDQIRWGSMGNNPAGSLLTLTQIVEELVRESDQPKPEPEPEPETVEVFQFLGGGSLQK